MDRMVVDASVAIAWVHPGQATAATDALLAKVEGGAANNSTDSTGRVRHGVRP